MVKRGAIILATALLAGCAGRVPPDLDVRVGGVPLNVELHIASHARLPLPYARWFSACKEYMEYHGHTPVELEAVGLYLQGAGPIGAGRIMLLNHTLREAPGARAELGDGDAVR